MSKIMKGENASSRRNNLSNNLSCREGTMEAEGVEHDLVEISAASTNDSIIANMNRRYNEIAEGNKAEKIWDFLVQLGVINELEEVSMAEKINEMENQLEAVNTVA
ncbi:hypothetical protein Ancab_019089, partial [Ancistrocladus abbreviatus]